MKDITCIFLVGIDNAEIKFEAIFYSIYGILTSDEISNSIKVVSLKYLLALATVSIFMDLAILFIYNFLNLKFQKIIFALTVLLIISNVRVKYQESR